MAPGSAPEWRAEVEKAIAEVGGHIEPMPSRLAIVRCDEVQPVPIDWLWRDWLARGKLHILAGAPGTGKTTLALSLAACISTGGAWPDGTAAKRGRVLLWSGEDGLSDVLVPRLAAAGADLSQIVAIGDVHDELGKRAFDPAHDIEALAHLMMEQRPDLLIIDPIISVVAGDSHKNAETRRSLQPLVDLASELGVALLGITHFSKGTAGREPVERVTGSLAFGALARVVMVAAKLPNDAGSGRIFCRAKSNIGPDKGGFAYTVEMVADGAAQEVSRIVWGQAVNDEARTILAQAETADADGPSKLEEAKDFLVNRLANGTVAESSLRREAKAAGHSNATLIRAKSALGVISVKNGMEGGWSWQLPPMPSIPTEGAQ